MAATATKPAADKAAGNGSAPAKLIDALPGAKGSDRKVEVLVVARNKLIVREGFNPRSIIEQAELDELQASIERRGVLQPLMVRKGDKPGTYLVLGGHRRLAAGDKANVKEYPVTVRDEATEADELVDAIVDNHARVGLSPLDEARAFARLRDAGLSNPGIAKECSVSERLVEQRLRIVDLPAPVQECFATVPAKIPTTTIPPLSALAQIDADLCARVVVAALEGQAKQDADEHGYYYDEDITPKMLARQPYEVIRSVAEKVSTCTEIHASTERGGAWSTGPNRYRSHFGVDMAKFVEGLGEPLDKELADMVAAMNGRSEYDRYRVAVDQAVVDQLFAARVLFRWGDSKDEGICVNPESLLALIEPIIREDHKRFLQSQADKRRAAEKLAKQSGESGGSSGATSVAAAADDRAIEYQQQLAKRDANIKLGEALIRSFAGGVDLTMDVAKWLAHTLFAEYEVRDMAARGLRYVLPQWQQESRQKNGKLKVRIAGDGTKAPKDAKAHAADRPLSDLFWEWLDLANTPQELIGRTLIAFAAAQYADQGAVPESRKSYFTVYGMGYGAPPRAEKVAKETLEKIVGPKLPKARKPRAKKPAAKKPAAAKKAATS